MVPYYLLAYNVGRLNKLRWIAEQSLMKTLASKHQTSVAAQYAKYSAKIQTPEGKSLKCLEVKRERKNKPPLIARFGGISLTRQPRAILNDTPYVHKVGRTEILRRLLADTCERCESTEDVEVHVRRFGGRDRAHQMVRELMEGSLYTPLTLPSKEEGDQSMWGRPGREKSPIF